MSSRILTASVIGVDAFNDDPDGVLKKAENGTVAVFANNAPAFYAITPARLAQLLDLEAKLARPGSDVALDGALFNDPAPAPVAVPLGKFAMYDGWQPDAEFQRMAALWGIALTAPATPEELASFVAYWQSVSPRAVAAEAGPQPANWPRRQQRPAEARYERHF